MPLINTYRRRPSIDFTTHPISHGCALLPIICLMTTVLAATQAHGQSVAVGRGPIAVNPGDPSRGWFPPQWGTHLILDTFTPGHKINSGGCK